MESNSNYTRLDRTLHKLSFSSSILQDILSDIETALFAKSWQAASSAKPIFITSLPRAGTTIILEALYRLPGLAAHTYRDMPFIFTPVLWNKLSGGVRSKGVLRERAHGDGLIISEDSPEAFEEVLWRKFFPDNYTDDHIAIWGATNSEFTAYFRLHMQKIISLRCPEISGSRYVSKNNGNIARTSAIKTMFPDSKIVIPLRDPIEHAMSLLRQHTNFLQQHAQDEFVKRYMADIGHYEFGSLHRPIQFPLLQSLTKSLSPKSLDYWLAYWIAAFDFLSKQSGVDFISYEKLCQFPEKGLGKLCEHLELKASAEEIASAASIFRSPTKNSTQVPVVEQGLSTRAEEIHVSLLSRCLIGDPE